MGEVEKLGGEGVDGGFEGNESRLKRVRRWDRRFVLRYRRRDELTWLREGHLENIDV